MSTASVPPPFLSRPELPEGAELIPRRPGWRPWTSLLALLAGIAGAVVGGLLLTLGALAFGASFDDPPPAVNILGTVVQDLCLIASALLFARLATAPRPRHFGLHGTRFWPAVGWTLLAWLAFYVLTALWLTVIGTDPPEDDIIQQLGVDDSTVALVAVAILVCVIAPITEEFFFRGYFFGALCNWRGIWPAAIITGIVFGGIHAGSSDVAFLLPLAFFGFALCLLYARTGSLYPPIVLHAINNSIAFGASQDWTWEIAVLFAGSLALLVLARLAVRRVWKDDPPVPALPSAPAPALA